MPGRVVIFGWAGSAHIRRWVTGLKERGYDIRLISLGDNPIDGIETFNLPRRGWLSYWRQAGRAVQLAREFKPDLVHVHYAGGFGYWGAKCSFAPLLMSVWGADIIDLPRNPINRLVIRRALKRADRVSATSEFLKTACENLLPGIDSKISVIPFGVTPPAEFVPLPPSPPVKLCFIKMHRRKYGPDILLRAFAAAAKKCPQLELTIAGEGPLTPDLKRLAVDLGVSEKVDFIGLIPNHRIYSLLQEHHIMVMPSVMDSESFGVAVLEASACARPVIASRIGGVPEVMRHGETGLLVPSGDVEVLTEAMIELAGNVTRCERMGQAGHAFVRDNYLWSRSLDMMTSLYGRLINGE